MKYQVWYMRPEFFSDGICGVRLPQANNLAATHIHLKDIEVSDGLNGVYSEMQGEIWSPNGEARELIRNKGLQHTSMSVGDVIIDDVGNVHVVAMAGFKAIGGAPKKTPQWKLVDKSTKAEIKKGDKRTTFRGERVMVRGMQPPHKPESSGKVNVVFIDDAATGEYYPGVIDAEYQLID